MWQYVQIDIVSSKDAAQNMSFDGWRIGHARQLVYIFKLNCTRLAPE